MGVEIIDLGKLDSMEAQRVLDDIEHATITSAASQDVRENLSKLLELNLNLSNIFEVEEVCCFFVLTFFLISPSFWN